jgi:NitT/TauT family transport system permease protein/taurine transport system permease protein
LGTLAALVAVWFLLTAVTGLVSGGRFPSPAEFWLSLDQIIGRGYAGATLGAHALQSLKLVVMGFVVAVATGVPLGLWMGWDRRVEAIINPVFLIIRPIPPLAWIPLAILWRGHGDAAKIMVIWFSPFVPSVINAFAGVRNIDRPILEAARMLGTPRWRMVVAVIAPAAAPMIFTGLRLSLQASWTTLVAAELVGALVGVGFVLNVAARTRRPTSEKASTPPAVSCPSSTRSAGAPGPTSTTRSAMAAGHGRALITNTVLYCSTRPSRSSRRAEAGSDPFRQVDRLALAP